MPLRPSAFPAAILALAPGSLAAQEPTPALLVPEVSVQGQRENALGPVDGYRAARSATATRTDTALRDVPQSIEVVPRDLIEDQQAVTLDQALANVSGVRSGGAVGNRAETYLLRGFRTNTRAVNGVLLNAALNFPESFLDVSNVERVEVLKGPASVLYGQGDPGGLINIVTRQPQVNPSAGLSVIGGSYGFSREELDVTGPLSADGTVTGRLTGAVQRDNGYRTNLYQAEREFIAPSVRWEPDAATRFQVDMTHIDQRTPFDRGLVAQGTTVTLPRTRFLGESWSRTSVERTDLTLRAERDAFSWLTLRSIAHFDWSDSVRISADPVSLSANGRTLTRRANNQLDGMQSVDLINDATARFTTGPFTHAATIGVEYAHARRSYEIQRATLASIDVFSPVYGAQPGRFSPYQYTAVSYDAVSFYAQDQVSIGPRLKFLGGARVDTYHQDNDTTLSGRRTYQSASGDAVTPRLGAVYAVTPEVSLFAGWSRSFLPQLGVDRLGNRFDPETGQQMEAGVKADLVPDRLSATLAAFQIRRRNVLATDTVDTTYSVQTGEQRSRGIELDVAGSVTRGWKVFASGAYTDAVVSRDTTFAVGNRLTGVPLWSGSLWTSYELQDGPARGAMLGAGVFTASTRTGDLNSSFRVDGYARVDLTASAPVLEDKARLVLTIRNLLDANYIEAPVSRTENVPGAPRTFLLSLKARI